MKTSASCSLPPADSLFQSAFDYAAIGIALVAPDGSWLRVNRALCDFTGYAEAEFMGRTFQEMSHPDDLELDLANVDKVLAGEIDTYQLEKRYFHKNGAIIWGFLSVSLVRDAAGEPCFFISQIQDITSRKENARRLDLAAERIRILQRSLIKVCAWTKRIELNGRWISVDEFLRDHLRLNLTHGISIEGARLLKEE